MEATWFKVSHYWDGTKKSAWLRKKIDPLSLNLNTKKWSSKSFYSFSTNIRDKQKKSQIIDKEGPNIQF